MLLAKVAGFQVGHQSPDQQEYSESAGNSPAKTPLAGTPGANFLFDLLAEFRARRKARTCCFSSALELHARDSVGGARGARAEMGVQGTHLLGRKFTVKVCVELRPTLFAVHGISSPLQLLLQICP